MVIESNPQQQNGNDHFDERDGTSASDFTPTIVPV